jgi:hypothetical protein
MGRVFEVSLGDLKHDTEEEAFRNFKLRYISSPAPNHRS